MAKSRTTTPVSKLPPDRETFLIVRALYESARHHLYDYDGDTELGQEMQDLLGSRYPDAVRAFTESDNLRKALEVGFLPPSGGITPDAVTAFLNAQSSKKKTKARYSLDDSDIPF